MITGRGERRAFAPHVCGRVIDHHRRRDPTSGAPDHIQPSSHGGDSGAPATLRHVRPPAPAVASRIIRVDARKWGAAEEVLAPTHHVDGAIQSCRCGVIQGTWKRCECGPAVAGDVIGLHEIGGTPKPSHASDDEYPILQDGGRELSPRRRQPCDRHPPFAGQFRCACAAAEHEDPTHGKEHPTGRKDWAGRCAGTSYPLPPHRFASPYFRNALTRRSLPTVVAGP